MEVTTRARRLTSWGLAGGVALSLSVGAVANGQAPPRPPLVIASVEGHDLYRFYCAPCHGRDGKGEGPVAASLTTAPPDLTTIARRHGGVFPRARVVSFVAHDGDALAPAHGSKDMPVWGPIFLGLDPSDTMASIRIENLVDAIGSMQVK